MGNKFSVIGFCAAVFLSFSALQAFAQTGDTSNPERGEALAPEVREKVPSVRELYGLVKELQAQNLVLRNEVAMLREQVNELTERLKAQEEQISSVKSATADLQSLKTDVATLERRTLEATNMAMNYTLQVEMRAIAAFSEAQNAATAAAQARQAVDVLEARYTTHRHLFEIPPLYGGGQDYVVRSGAEILAPDR